MVTGPVVAKRVHAHVEGWNSRTLVRIWICVYWIKTDVSQIYVFPVDYQYT